MMRRWITGAAVLAGLAFAMPATATKTFTFNGSSGTFGNDGVTAPTFADEFDLGAFAAGEFLFTGTITSSFQTGQTGQDIDFTSVSLNNTPFTIGTSGQFEFRYVSNVPSAAPNLLRVAGNSGSTQATYSGTFNVAAVPELSSWMLMLAGFGLSGLALRRTRRSGVGSSAITAG